MKQNTQTNIIPLIVIVGGSALLFMLLGLRHSMGLYLVPITNHLGVGREVFGFAIAIQFLLVGIGSPLFGAMSDKFGSGKAAFIGVIMTVLGFVWMANINNTFDLVGSQILSGLGAAGCGTVVVLGAVGRSVKTESRTLSLGVIMAAGSFGQFVMVPFVAFLIQKSGWSNSLLYLAVFALIMVLFSFILSFSKKSPISIKSNNQTIKEALSEAFKTRSFNFLTIGFFVCGFHVTFVATHLPAFLEDLSSPSWVAGWALALIGLFNIIGTLLFGYMGDRLSKKNLLASLYSLRSTLFIVFIVSPKNEITVLIFAGLLGILWLSTVPLTSGIISDVFGPYYMSMLYGITLLSHQVGSFFGAWLGGRIYDLYGSYDAMWWICVALGFISAALHVPITGKPVLRLSQE